MALRKKCGRFDRPGTMPDANVRCAAAPRTKPDQRVGAGLVVRLVLWNQHSIAIIFIAICARIYWAKAQYCLKFMPF
jgi:hypothetical protein